MGKISDKGVKQANKGNALFLDNLEEGSVGPITVMVCRRWDVNNINGRYMSTDFIVSDKKGNLMHCIAKNNIAHYFIDKLQEGLLYSLRDFTVQPNRDEYRIMKDASFIIELQGSTVVTKVTDASDGFVRHPFELVAFEDLKATDGKYFVDVIGYVVVIGQPSKKKTGSQTLDFDLTNERGRQVRVTLWGSLGDDMVRKKEQKPGVYTIILTCMSVKYYLGHLCLSSSSSTLLIDSDEVPALQEFTSHLSNVNMEEATLPIMQSQEKMETLGQLLQWARDRKHSLACRAATLHSTLDLVLPAAFLHGKPLCVFVIRPQII